MAQKLATLREPPEGNKGNGNQMGEKKTKMLTILNEQLGKVERVSVTDPKWNLTSPQPKP